jgi:O-antigen/teichoic acid export membrane protein
MNKQLSLKKNFVLNMLYQILRIITPFITSPYISRVLGVSQLGVYSYTTSYLTYFTLFASLGTGTYGMREIARARNDEKKRSRLFWEIEILTVLTSSITLACWFIFTLVHSHDHFYYLILSLNTIAVTFDISWFYAGMELFQYTLGMNALTKILCVIAILVFVKKPSDLSIYMFILGGFTLLGNMAIWMSLPKFVHRIDFKTIHLKHHFKETAIYFLPTIASSVYNVMDKTMIWKITEYFHDKAPGVLARAPFELQREHHLAQPKIASFRKKARFIAPKGHVLLILTFEAVSII